MARLLIDTGFLVALYIRGDTLHNDAVDYLRGNHAALLTVAPVIVETCFFLDVQANMPFTFKTRNSPLARKLASF